MDVECKQRERGVPSPGVQIRSLTHGRDLEIAWIKSRDLAVLSCYTCRNSTNDVFNQFLHALETGRRVALASGLEVLVGGDFNAKSPEWDSVVLDANSSTLTSLVAGLGLLIGNLGSVPSNTRRS